MARSPLRGRRVEVRGRGGRRRRVAPRRDIPSTSRPGRFVAPLRTRSAGAPRARDSTSQGTARSGGCAGFGGEVVSALAGLVAGDVGWAAETGGAEGAGLADDLGPPLVDAA